MEPSGLLTRMHGATKLVPRDIQRRPVDSGGTSSKLADAFRFGAIRIWNRLRIRGLDTLSPNEAVNLMDGSPPRFDGVR